MRSVLQPLIRQTHPFTCSNNQFAGDNATTSNWAYSPTPILFFFKGFFDQKTAADMMKESAKMQNFQHPHVLNIIGVCVDAGPAPYIIMPFIANGSLLAYIKKEKTHLVIPNDADDELASSYYTMHLE